MSFNQLIESYQDIEEEYALLKSRMTRLVKNKFESSVREFLEENPEIIGLVWTQYTPYFNDGDPCVFTIGEVGFIREEDAAEYDDLSEIDAYETSGYTWEDRRRGGVPDYSAVETFIEGLGDVAQDLWGNGVKIVVTKDGMGIFDYDHD